MKESSDTPIWARSRETRRTTLTREMIVTAAVKLADAEGLGAVSIRRVATELGARTMSLYTYIDSKDDLLDLMGNETAGEALIEGELPEDWREAIKLISRQELLVALRHPWMIELLGHWPRVGPNALRHLEQSLEAISGLKADERLMWRALVAVDDYVLGYVIRAIRERETPRAIGRRILEQDEWIQTLLAGGEFPRLASALGDKHAGIDDNFETGLTWVLDGIAAEIEK